jgi:hypothetical protein
MFAFGTDGRNTNKAEQFVQEAVFVGFDIGFD